MRDGGKILAQILQELKNKIEPGLSGKELEQTANKLFDRFQVQASFKGYNGFPSCICLCVNEEVVHGIPGERKFQKGDLITIDCGVYYKGLHTDSAITTYIEPVNQKIKNFVTHIENILYEAIALAKPGKKTGDLSCLIETRSKQYGYSPVHELTGHGVGRDLHEAPMVPNFGKANSGQALIPGMTIAIEPILSMGKRYIVTLADHWTIATRDKSLSAQAEHTILITKTGSEILTKI